MTRLQIIMSLGKNLDALRTLRDTTTHLDKRELSIAITELENSILRLTSDWILK